VRDGREVFDPYPNHSCCAKKPTDFSPILTWGPVPNLGDFCVAWDASFVIACLSDNDDIQSTCKELLGRYGCTSVLQLMENTIDIVAVFPHKMTDARVLRYGLI